MSELIQFLQRIREKNQICYYDLFSHTRTQGKYFEL